MFNRELPPPIPVLLYATAAAAAVAVSTATATAAAARRRFPCSLSADAAAQKRATADGSIEPPSSERTANRTKETINKANDPHVK